MATLRQVLDDALLLLENPGFKTPGDVKKHQYQMSKPEEDREIRRIMYEGGLGNSEEAKLKTKKTKEVNRKKGKYDETYKKAASRRSDWYKNPENYKKFKEKIRQRDIKKQQTQSSGNKS